MKNIEFEKLVKSRLSEKRFNHVKAVAKLSKELAKHYGADEEKAVTAAFLHDITKEVELDKQLQTIMDSDIIIDNGFLGSPNLYHSVTAFIYAKSELGISDEDILSAILYHTTGKANMNILEKIIFAADKVSYDRTYSNATELRQLAFEDIDECVFEICSFLICDLVKRGLALNKDTVLCYNQLCEKRGIKNEKGKQES